MSSFQKDDSKTYWISEKIYYYYDVTTNSNLTCSIDSSISFQEDQKKYNSIKVNLTIKDDTNKLSYVMKFRELTFLNMYLEKMVKMNNKSDSASSKNFPLPSGLLKGNSFSISTLPYESLSRQYSTFTIFETELKKVSIEIPYKEIMVLYYLTTNLVNNFFTISSNMSSICNQEISIDIYNKLNESINVLSQYIKNDNEKTRKMIIDKKDYVIQERVKEPSIIEENDNTNIIDEDVFDFISPNNIKSNFDVHENFNKALNNINFDEIEVGDMLQCASVMSRNTDGCDYFIGNYLNHNSSFLNNLYCLLFSTGIQSDENSFCPIKNILDIACFDDSSVDIIESDGFYLSELYNVLKSKINIKNYSEKKDLIDFPKFKYENSINPDSDTGKLSKTIILLYVIYTNLYYQLKSINCIDRKEFLSIQNSFLYIRDILLILPFN